jgi:hypothetical protein
MRSSSSTCSPTRSRLQLRATRSPTSSSPAWRSSLPSMPRGIVGLVQKYWDRSVAPIELPHIRLPDAIAAGRAHRATMSRLILSTSASNRTMSPCSNIPAARRVFEGRDADPREPDREHGADAGDVIEGGEKGKEIALTALPLYHIFAFTVNLAWLSGDRRAQPADPQSAAAHQPQTRLRELQDHLDERGEHALQRAVRTRSGFSTRPPKHLKFASAGGMALAGSGASGGRRSPANRSAGLRPDRNLTCPDLQPPRQDAGRFHRRARPRRPKSPVWTMTAIRCRRASAEKSPRAARRS